MSPEGWAGGWLLGLAVLSMVYCIRLARNSDYDWWESCLYLPTYLFGRLLWRVHFTNVAPAELRSGAVLAANHRSSVDPFFVQLAARRRVHWMVAKEYCQHFAFGPLLRALQVIPTNRSGMDTASTKTALRLTHAGRLVGMFPEGRINQTESTLLPLRGGAALVAIRTGVPMIPLWIEGSPLGRSVWSPVLMPARVTITFGEPLWPEGGSGTNAVAQSSIAGTKSNADRELSPELGTVTETAQKADKNRDALAASDELIVQWGRQIMALAGRAGTPIELASQRKNRNRS